jgi:hypothetical protein
MKNIYLSVLAMFCLFHTLSAQLPKLNSYPSASAVIFLDFDGHVVQGTSWNWEGPIYCNSANMNSTQVTEVFNRVAEDYRPFNINVTTDSTVYQAAPARQRTRVVLTTSSSWYGVAGGVAFTNSFTWGDNTPCFVFTALHNYHLKNISEATSHEVGHTLGLSHQSAYDAVCNKTAEYNAGGGTGEIGWAPIMGVGYYRNVTLWHYGSNPWGCSYLQDDLGIITGSANGFGFRADDNGNSLGTATPATVTGSRLSVQGVIERPNDADVYSFNLTGSSKLQLEALPYNVAAGFSGANVDLQVELTNGTETLIYNPSNLLRVSIDSVFSAGTWYLKILSKGNVFAPDFASLGSYTISANIIATTLPLHRLALKATAENNRHKLDWEIVADENIVEQIIEVAEDGLRFQPLSTVSDLIRMYQYVPVNAAQLYYRMKVTFDNRRTHYSNVVSLQSNSANSKPVLKGNVITSNLRIYSPPGYHYAVSDMAGRQLSTGRLTVGDNFVSLRAMPAGLYLIRFTNNQEQYTEKFSKQ